jgi:hypothetical protein
MNMHLTETPNKDALHPAGAGRPSHNQSSLRDPDAVYRDCTRPRLVATVAELGSFGQGSRVQNMSTLLSREPLPVSSIVGFSKN